MQEFKSTVRRGLSDRRERQLIINNELIKFEDNRINKTFTTLPKEEIAEYRYGIHWYRYRFVFGRKYNIEIKTTDGKILKIYFKSYLRYRLKDLHQQYCNILNALWDYHFEDMTEFYFSLLKQNIDFNVAGVRFSEKGLHIKNNTFIEWEDIRTGSYQTYFIVYSQKNPAKTNRAYYYLEDWNVSVLYSVLRTTLKIKGIETYSI
ncbi:hypothetical protein [Flavobacterium beibuense]|uniref:hypothetical protein n=1 Tax=Flavobacterium beibuense TaxID=657326 RepID=UPI003A90116F